MNKNMQFKYVYNKAKWVFIKHFGSSLRGFGTLHQLAIASFGLVWRGEKRGREGQEEEIISEWTSNTGLRYLKLCKILVSLTFLNISTLIRAYLMWDSLCYCVLILNNSMDNEIVSIMYLFIFTVHYTIPVGYMVPRSVDESIILLSQGCHSNTQELLPRSLDVWGELGPHARGDHHGHAVT